MSVAEDLEFNKNDKCYVHEVSDLWDVARVIQECGRYRAFSNLRIDFYKLWEQYFNKFYFDNTKNKHNKPC